MTVQRLTISDWLPTSTPNAQARHWRDVQERHHIDRDTAWASAKQAGWVFVPGKVRLSITFVYPRKYRVDPDNLAARCKGVIDGLKAHPSPWVSGERWAPLGYFEDDDTEHLDLHVGMVVERGVRALRIEMEPV